MTNANTPSGDALTEAELSDIEAQLEQFRWDLSYRGMRHTGLPKELAADMLRLIAALRRARAENEALVRSITAIVQREVQRAEAMGNKPEEYPKQYVDGRYRTAIEILGQISMIFPVGTPRTADDVVRDGRSASLWAEIDAMYAKIMGVAPRLRVGQRVRVKAGYRRTIIALGWQGEALETFPNDGEIIIIKEIVGTNIVADHGSVVPLEFVEAVT